MTKIGIWGVVVALCGGCSVKAWALPEDSGDERSMAGTMEAEVNGRRVEFPSLKVEVEADIAGDVATVSVVQTFVNPLESPVHATYLFPLNEQAAVFEMTMDVGDERVRAEIKEKAEAVRTFNAAKAEGRSAALLTEHRPNMFTQEVANLMPGLPIRVTLKYVHAVMRRDGEYQLVIPLVVGPRFEPPVSSSNKSMDAGGPASDPEVPNEPKETGQWSLSKLPVYPPVSGLEIPDTVPKERVQVRIHLQGGMKVSDLGSKTHKIKIEEVTGSKDRYEIGLDGGPVIDNRDFVLRYKLGGEHTTTGLLAYRDGRGGYFSLLIEPPPMPVATEIRSREMVFLLDCSGSMDGLPIDASKAFMRQALRGLRHADTFRIIRFGDNATEYSNLPLAATPENVSRAIAYVDQLHGQGGTMMTTGVAQALSQPVPPGAIRIVTFLTDGYIGNEVEVLALVRRLLGDARLYAFGVGTGVNRFLLEKLGKMGRGFTRYMSPTESVDAVAKELAARLDAPVLTDIAVDWGGLSPDSLVPDHIGDLFAGDSVRISGHYDKPGTYTVKVTGKIGGQAATLPLKVTLPDTSGSGEGVALIWARSTIDELMDHFTTPDGMRDPKIGDDDLRQLVTELGLEFKLITRWTSFVAVSERIYNEHPEAAPTLPVPLHKVEGVSDKAYGDFAHQNSQEEAQRIKAPSVLQPSSGGLLAFAGESAPEPAATAGLTVLVVAAALAMRRKRIATMDTDGTPGVPKGV